MAQHRVYRLPGGPLVVDLQSDLIATPTRIVAPLFPPGGAIPAFTRLEPVFEIEGERLALHVGEMAAVPAKLVAGPAVADLSERDREIRGALDMIFSDV